MQAMTTSLGLPSFSSSPIISSSFPLPSHKALAFFPPRADRSTATGTCRASQAVDLFPTIWSGIMVRDAVPEDYWGVADTHCSCFFPNCRFPINLLLRINRFDDVELEDIGSIKKGCVAGILTVDTMAEFLPRKGPLLQRRTRIAYISNLAVRKAHRGKGIAKMLIANAEARAWSWGCRSMALHCDVNNLAAMRLYKEQGYKCIQVPENAKWPKPSSKPGTQFNLMMKIINPNATP
ncbi:GCN5-related N-acetyltransferase 4, chloroplastic-like isoform X2 [Curcuma longa]|uniref:GCN5-related N-acetyltransferase 4, chloroplastic-like isoform X2 n=1 Tax=Curcuma longa TaxID=136217 RepID=UPI003D9DB984